MLLIVGLAAGYVIGRLVSTSTVTPERFTGTVTWSNSDSHAILFDADGEDPTERPEYTVVGEYWFDSTGAPHSGGYPECLSGTSSDAVRTDERRVELGVILQDDSDLSAQIAVAVQCLN